jgi:hypothetical protein
MQRWWSSPASCSTDAGSHYPRPRPERHPQQLNIIGLATEQDLLILTELFANQRNIRQTDGLEAATNLNFLDLDPTA